MKAVNRKRALFVCLIILLVMLFESLTRNLFLYLDVLSMVYGFACGWVLRETLSSKHEEKDTKPEPSGLTDVNE